MSEGIKIKTWIYMGALCFALFFLIAAPLTTDALTLENQYPKIPLPSVGSIKFDDGPYSLNDIAGRIKPPFNTLNPLSGLIYYLFTFAVSVVGIIAFGVIIYTGVMFIMSGSRPQLRAQAMGRIRNTILGIALLLGSVIILNTINPELTILNVPPAGKQGLLGFNIPSPFGTEIDLATLHYGGVVLYAESATDGQENRSETVLNNIKNFNDGTYIGDDDLSAIKILGNCDIALFRNNGFEAGVERLVGLQSLELTGPKSENVGFPNLKFENDSASSLRFTNTSCLGHSITAYGDLGYAGQTKALIVTDGDLKGDKLLMHRQCPPGAEIVSDLSAGNVADHCDIFGNPLNPKNHEHNADNNIESIGFAREPLEEFSITACKYPTNETNRVEDCKDIPQSASLGGVYQNLYNEISAIIFRGNGKNRQAGVVLYEEDNFGGKSEIFIAGDNNLGKNFIDHDQASSMQIIGKYKVTLYEKDLSDSGGGKTLIFDNTEGSTAVVSIKKLSTFTLDATKGWDNQISAIKIEVPKEIYDTQHLGTSPCATDLCEL